jgi:hypothetical protein
MPEVPTRNRRGGEESGRRALWPPARVTHQHEADMGRLNVAASLASSSNWNFMELTSA